MSQHGQRKVYPLLFVMKNKFNINFGSQHTFLLSVKNKLESTISYETCNFDPCSVRTTHSTLVGVSR